MKRLIIAATGAALALSGGMLTSPANASPVITGGVVNVTVTDVVDDVTVVVQDINVTLGAALGIAANVCDTNVNVLAKQLRTGGAECTSDASGQTVEIGPVS